MTSVNIIYRPSVKAGRHPGSLCLRLIHNRRGKTITLCGCKLYAEEWDKEGQSIVYPGGAPPRTAYLEKAEQTVIHEKMLLESHLSALEKQGRYSVEELAGLYRLHKDNGKLLGYCRHLAFGMEQGGQGRTTRAYRSVSRALIDFNKGHDIPLSHINARLCCDKLSILYLRSLKYSLRREKRGEWRL